LKAGEDHRNLIDRTGDAQIVNIGFQGDLREIMSGLKKGSLQA